MSGKPWRSPLLYVGLALWAVGLAAWGVAWAIDAEVAVRMGATFAAFLVGGKFAAIPTGLSLGLAPPLVAGIVVVPDAGAVLVSYPFLERGWEAAHKVSHVLAEAREKAMRNAESRQGVVARFGSWGLLGISLTPVAFISPVVVAAIGQLMGLGWRRVLAPVLAGMLILTVVLVTAFTYGLGAAARVHPALPFMVTGLIVAALLGRELHLRRKAFVKKRAAADEDAGG